MRQLAIVLVLLDAVGDGSSRSGCSGMAACAAFCLPEPLPQPALARAWIAFRPVAASVAVEAEDAAATATAPPIVDADAPALPSSRTSALRMSPSSVLADEEACPPPLEVRAAASAAASRPASTAKAFTKCNSVSSHACVASLPLACRRTKRPPRPGGVAHRLRDCT